MGVLEFSLIVGVGSLVAGFFGALTGLGGGVVIVPMLTLLLGVDIRYAIGASLVSVIATSSGERRPMCEKAYPTSGSECFSRSPPLFGAVAGATLATHISTGAVSIVFGVVLIGSASLFWKRPAKNASDDSPDALATRLRLNGSFPERQRHSKYNVRRVSLGWGLMFGAGTLSGLLGIGSGAMKVLAMDQAMKIPFKVSTTTSNFMIGVTAAASAGIYLSAAISIPGFPCRLLGVLAGSLLGTRVLVKTHPKWLRRIFRRGDRGSRKRDAL